MARFRMTCIGTSPLLMHNSRLANPLDPIVKEIRVYSKKRTKTDDDHEQLAKLEHAGGMYWAEGVGPYIPGANVRKVLIEAARKTKQGKLVEQGVFIDTLYNPLAYDGPRDLEGLWADKNFVDIACVKVMNARLMRTRPVFHTWACNTEATYDKTLLDFKQINEIAQTAGAYIGLGDYRPLYGRFRVEVEELPDEPATAAA
jgi:hypothetical protein